MIRLLLVITSAIFIAACGGSDSGKPDPRISEVKEELKIAKQLWQDNGLIDYMFNFSARIDRACPSDGPIADKTPTRMVTVEDNEVTSVTSALTGEPMIIPTFEYFGTIDELFNYLEEELAKEPQVIAQSFSAQNELPMFDESLGYPIQFYLEFNNSNGCSSTQITLSEFR
ncbi:MAG: DUF6174 domain-containing protein [Pseudomonadota bacterium]